LSAVPESARRPPVFTPRQCNGIRKIARKFGFAWDQQADFVHETWVKFAEGWMRVPRVEPSMSKYVFRIARNLAIDLFRRFEDDAMTGAVVFSCLPEWEREEEDEQPGEDRPGTPQVVTRTMVDRIRARQIWHLALERDPDAAVWMKRLRVEGETGAEIAADVGQPVARVYRRVARLEEALARLEPPEPETLARLVEVVAEERGLDLKRHGRFLGPREGPERPQLAMEVAWTRSGIGLAAYRALGVGEVWSWEDGRICVFVLSGSRFEEADHSALVPGIDLPLVARLATRDSETVAVRELREVVRMGDPSGDAAKSRLAT